ncbi:hypothetical protein Cgig2_013488 [Carnegiea gigantea]|uniref:SWIM-type domain-containing protein n=1 Tax=Carnegiea gigantea TaxID=171969 RepID=A0A9Q1GM37_9CARY|nr:hypothetical protein Cgig2_013488 [Carnegiea gigantea]
MQGDYGTDIEYEDLILVSVDENLSMLQVDAFTVDDDGNVVRNVFSKMYQTGGMWARNKDGKIYLSVGDMFVDKEQRSQVIKEYVIQEGISLRKIKNDRFRHIRWDRMASEKLQRVLQMSKGEFQQCYFIFLDSSTPCCRLQGKPPYHYTGYGLMKAMTEIFPECGRRICAVHYYRNFAREYPGVKLHSLFFTAANAYNYRAIEKIYKVNKNAHSWLIEEPTQHWASFNGKIERFRHKPIMVLLEAILHKFMSIIAKRVEIAKEWNRRVPKVTKQLLKLELDSRTYKVTPARMGEFLVQDGNTNFTINLNTGHCDCMFWDISRIPCKHAIRCILRERLDPETFVHKAFSIDKYRFPYGVVIHPVRDQSFWEARNLPKLGPPPIDKVGPERPETSRRKDVTESRA